MASGTRCLTLRYCAMRGVCLTAATDAIGGHNSRHRLNGQNSEAEEGHLSLGSFRNFFFGGSMRSSRSGILNRADDDRKTVYKIGSRRNSSRNLDPCICESAYQDSSGRGRPEVPGSQEAVGEHGSPRPLANASRARTVDRAAPRARARIGQGRVGRPGRSGAMAAESYVGIDVSKAELVVAVRPSGERLTLANDRAGIKRLVGRLGELKPTLVVVEATGGLQRQVVAGLWLAGIAVAAVNPSWVRNFAKGRGVMAKTDRKDAELLALFAQRERPEPRPPADAETQALQDLVMRREQLLEMLVAEKQRLHRASGPMRKELRHHIAYLEGRIKELEEDIDKTVRRSDAWRRKSEIVRSVPGFGKAFC